MMSSRLPIGLSMTVEASVALFQSVGVPGNFHVDDLVAVILQVNAFRGGISRK